MTKTALSLKQLLYLAIAAFGIQFATALQMSNTTSLYKFLGAQNSNLSLLWLAAPIAGLIIQPLVGQLSDSTATRFGKRIPYLFCWGIFTAITLAIMPFVGAVWSAALLLWIMECSINGSTETLRALTADLTVKQQKAKAYAIQTVFAGIGSGIAATLPWLIHQFIQFQTAQRMVNYIPEPIKIAFFIGSIVILVTTVSTLFQIKEKPFNKMQLLAFLHKPRKKLVGNTGLFVKELVFNIKRMPLVIRKFYLIQIFTWTGLFCFWLYFNLAISQHFFGLPPGAHVNGNPHYVNLLEKGTEWGGIGYGVYQFVSVVYAMILTMIVGKFSPKLIHSFSLVMGGLGITSIFFLHNLQLMLVSMIGVGMMWGSIMCMPYAIISAELPPAKMGVYLGLFNMTITIPQILCGLVLGTITTRLFNNHATLTLILGGICLIIAGIILYIQYRMDQQIVREHKNILSLALEKIPLPPLKRLNEIEY